MTRILLLRPYQPTRDHADSPPLGLLYLATSLRRRFGDGVEVVVRDMKLQRLEPEWLVDNLRRLRPDVVGVSAMNCEADAAHFVAEIVKEYRPDILTVLGGPYAHRRANEILGSSVFDWVFQGPADLTFPEALDRHLRSTPLGADIAGFSYRHPCGVQVANSQDTIRDLDQLGFPAWDLVDFDHYARATNMMSMLKGKRYATLFTSRGCPYRCNYCHDIFGKGFIYRSAEHVLEEIEILYERYGVDEFEIVDDIFNLHKPRLKRIMSEVKRRWPGRIHFCFPNGVRADIMDEDVVEALHQGGTYAIAIAIETVTPRLQTMIDKNLDVAQARRVIGFCSARGMVTRGFFMLGFPTETESELRATVDFAVAAPLTTAFFFTVTPQPATPMFELAAAENSEALRAVEIAERHGQGYRNDECWYQRANGFDMRRYVQRAYRRFYLSPRRVWFVLTQVPPRSLWFGLRRVMTYVFGRSERADARRPGAEIQVDATASSSRVPQRERTA